MDFLDVLLMLLGWCTPGYLVLQWFVWRRTAGKLRTAAKVVAGVMGALAIYILLACVVGRSNIAPIIFLFAAPPACLILLIIWLLQRRVNKRAGKAT